MPQMLAWSLRHCFRSAAYLALPSGPPLMVSTSSRSFASASWPSEGPLVRLLDGRVVVAQLGEALASAHEFGGDLGCGVAFGWFGFGLPHGSTGWDGVVARRTRAYSSRLSGLTSRTCERSPSVSPSAHGSAGLAAPRWCTDRRGRCPVEDHGPSRGPSWLMRSYAYPSPGSVPAPATGCRPSLVQPSSSFAVRRSMSSALFPLVGSPRLDSSLWRSSLDWAS